MTPRQAGSSPETFHNRGRISTVSGHFSTNRIGFLMTR
jgi:hypothetical protein